LCVKVASTSLQNIAEFKYWGKTVTNESFIPEELQSGQNLGSACCCALQSLLSFHLLSKNVKIKMEKSIILLFVFCGYETTFAEEHRLVEVFETRMLRQIFGPMRHQ
jgi:hypothetical protein